MVRLMLLVLYNHGHNSVAKGQKHRKNPPPPLSMLIQ